MKSDSNKPVDWSFDEESELNETAKATTDTDNTDHNEPEARQSSAGGVQRAPSEPARASVGSFEVGSSGHGALTANDFPAFFEALWGYAPFEWQSRLLERVRSGGWPATLDLPTGSGKTATLDIAVFALALDAFEAPEARRQPRRVVLVVDRRVVVDQGYERAVHIADALNRAREGTLARVARALRTLGGEAEAPPVLPAILRGGMPREGDWARTPDQPVILVSTVDQVGSRLLFRGYGVSDRMKSVHAGLLGRDTLYLLDEVHLSRPFEETLEAVQHYGSKEDGSERLLRPLKFVRMSATVASKAGDCFCLGDADRRHAVLARRLGASKLAAIRTVKTARDPKSARGDLARACAEEVKRLSKHGALVIAVIVNRVETARQAAVLIEGELGGSWEVELLVGRMRPLDRADAQVGLLDCIRAGRVRTDDHIVLVSTQAVEAGADFDFDALVTECASLDALRQRFGRLDRMGELGKSRGVILAASSSVDEKAEPDPVYGDALRATFKWLDEVGEQSDGGEKTVDFGISALEPRLADAGSDRVKSLLAPRLFAPVLTGSHLDRWAQTSPVTSADPEVAPFLHGVERGAPEVQLVWRTDIDLDSLRVDELAWLRSVLAAVPPGAGEVLSLPLWTAVSWLGSVAARADGDAELAASAKSVEDVADVEGSRDVETEVSRVAPALLWRGDDTIIAVRPDEIRPGDTIIVPSSYGGISARFRCWDPEETAPVSDRGDEVQLLQRGRAVVRWNENVLGHWRLPTDLGSGPKVATGEDLAVGEEDEHTAFNEWREAVLGKAIPDWARVALESMGKGTMILRFDRSREPHTTWRAAYWQRRLPAQKIRPLLRLPSLSPPSGIEATTEGDEGSFTGREVSLAGHLDGVRDHSLRFAEALALPASIAEDVVLAGWLHDLGKSDPRFQLLLHGGDPVAEAIATEPLAKSRVAASNRMMRERARERAGYPKNTRHELMSVALVQHQRELEAKAHDWDLVLHLIASHHGYGRPFAFPVNDPDPVEVAARIDGIDLGASSDHGLTRFSSGVADRFWRLTRRYGWWGLAWLESILRLADHRESEREVVDG